MASDPTAAARYEKVFAEMSCNAERVEKGYRWIYPYSSQSNLPNYT